jgi:hypothetical protein
MTKLYELTNELRGLNALVENGDLDEGQIADTIESLDLDIKDKIKGCLMARQNLIGSCSSIENEINRLKAIVSAKNNQIDGITNYVKHNMIEMGLNKIDVDLFKVTIRKSSIKLGSLDEDKIPPIYFETVPESKKLNKRALLSAAKLETIDGVELTESERGITIK